jgi:putative transposase
VIRSRPPRLKEIPVERCCQVLGVCRSEYYSKSAVAAEDDLNLAIQTEADKRIPYGYRRIAESLWKKGNRRATPKRVRSRMRKLGLSRRPKRRKARTTTPGKGPAAPNLAANLNLERPRQLLVTDLTYVALPKGFAYVSVVLDAFSRRALGWAASESLATELPLEALDMVLSQETLPKGWVHHSDRGCQYTSQDYKERIEQHLGLLSNSKPGCPYDNAKMESFFKTYKYEEANLQTYSSLEDLKLNLSTFLEDYNSVRLHSSIGYCSPIEFETLHNQLDKEICVR